MKRIKLISSHLRTNGYRSSTCSLHCMPKRLVSHRPKEITIKVPWGHISGLHWNESTSATPFICLHGWKDNAASFDRIIPALLDKSMNYQFLAIDLPGHGYSSHYPPGMIYQFLDHLVLIRRLLSQFGWSEAKGLHIMGHSLGAIFGFLFAASHPKLVDCVIAIDALIPVSFNKGDLVTMLGTITEGCLKMESISKSERKAYTKNVLREKFLGSHMGINELAGDILLTRGITETASGSGKWIFSHDPRVHYLPFTGISEEYMKSFAKTFRSKLLLIKAENGVIYYSDYMEANIQNWLAENNKHCVRFVTAKDAIHHVHLTEPEKIVPDIIQFLADTHSDKIK